MKLNEVKRRTGLKHSTIRVYEERGLVTPDTAERNGRLYREYSEEDVARLEVVSGLRKALFSIEQIKLMLEDPELIPALLVSHRKKVDALAEELEQLKASLDAIDTPPKSAAELNARLSETAVRQMPLPQADVHPRFRYLDELYPPTGREDTRKLRLPPKVKFFTPLYFTLLPFILLAAVLLSVYFIRGGLGKRTVNLGIQSDYQLSLYVLEEASDTTTGRVWEFHESSDKYTNYHNWDLATLDRSENKAGVTWRLKEQRYPYDDAHTHYTTRSDYVDGRTVYRYDGKEEIQASRSAQRIDRFSSEILLLEQPVTGRQVLLGILSGLLVVAVGHVIFFGARVGISLNLYRARFTKMANAGYEAANFIEDDEHLYGPEKNDIELLPSDRE